MVMEMVFSLALVIPIVLPAALFVWYLNAGGIKVIFKRARGRRTLETQEN